MTSPQKKTGGRFQQLPGALAIGWALVAVWVLVRSDSSTRFVHAGILLAAALISGIVALIGARRRRAAEQAAEHAPEQAPEQPADRSSEHTAESTTERPAEQTATPLSEQTGSHAPENRTD